MKSEIYKRRQFLKSSLAIPVLANIPHSLASTCALVSPQNFVVPDKVFEAVYEIYGTQASNILTTHQLVLKVPAIAENGAVVNVRLEGEQGIVKSMAILVENNTHPLVNTSVLHHGVDLPIALRFKLEKTSNVYLIAQTSSGLVGMKEMVKLTIGCGGV